MPWPIRQPSRDRFFASAVGIVKVDPNLRAGLGAGLMALLAVAASPSATRPRKVSARRRGRIRGGGLGRESPCGRRVALRLLWGRTGSRLSGIREDEMMSVRIGFDHSIIGHRPLSAEATLEFARAHGLDGVQFLDPETIDPALDPERLAAFRRRADALGLYLEVGIPSPNPVRRSRQEDRHVTAEEHERDLERHIEAVAALGCRHARAYVGDRHDRFRIDTRWDAQRAATLDVLRRLAPRLRDLDIRVALENHADLTADELLAMLDQLGPELAGVTLDTGNLLMRLDEPVRAADRLAPHVLSTHVKDAVLDFNPRVNLSIELHSRIYDLPIYDRTWLAFFPDLRPESLAAVVRLAVLCEHRFVEGSLIRPEAVEATPWAERDLDWLASSLGYLRQTVGMIARLDS